MKEKKLPFKKKKILFHSCHSRQLSGFGKNCKNILRHLCLTGKYEIVEFANAYKWSDPKLKTLPWKCIGSGPDDKETIVENNENEISGREMSYGLLKIDQVIKKEKPDIYIGAEDIWAFIKISQKPWWNNINCMLWTTLDSLPLLQESINIAKKTKHYYTWANFAKKEANKIGLDHVKCLHGAIETGNFFKLQNNKREELRKEQGIKKDDFIIGFVFRNQLRKSVPNLLDGFKILKSKNKTLNAKLLLHTGWHEGWDINSLIKEKNINPEDILTTYYCKECQNYKIKSYCGSETFCDKCKSNTLKTIAVDNGPSEKQLNEIYNLMDVYCHPFTSGGQEIPIQEAKLCELITLSTNYSCGEDMNTKESYGLPLEWSEYREPGTQFIKASTSPESICKQILKVVNMAPKEREENGRKARNFILKNYETSKIGGQLEKIIDSMPTINYDFNFSDSEINPNYVPPEITDPRFWILDIYKNMFSTNLRQNDNALKFWINKIKEGESRESILANFKNIALKEKNIKSAEPSFEEYIKTENKENIIAVTCDGNKYDTLCCCSALKEMQKLNPESKIIFITHPSNFDILKRNPYVYKKIPFFESSLNIKKMEEKYVNICYVMPKNSDQFKLYHGGKDKISKNITNEPLI